MSEKIILGLIEKVTIFGSEDKSQEIDARIDTGATNSSIDYDLAANLRLGPIIKNKVVRQSNGKVLRPVIEVEILIKGKKIVAEFTISNRSHMKYDALIGQNILKKGFLIDPSK